MKEQLQEALAAVKAGNEEEARVLLAQLLKDDPEYVPGWVLLSKLAPNDIQKAAFLEKIVTLDPDHAYARTSLEQLRAGSPTPMEPAPALDEEVAALDIDGEALPPSEPEPEVNIHEPAPEPAPAVETVFDSQPEPEAESDAALPEQRGMPISADPYDYESQAVGDTLPPWLADEEEVLAEPEMVNDTPDADRMPPEPELPDWLQEEPAAAWQEGEGEEPSAPPLPATPPPVQQKAPPVPSTAPASASRSPGSAWLLTLLSVAAIIVFLLLMYALLTL